MDNKVQVFIGGLRNPKIDIYLELNPKDKVKLIVDGKEKKLKFDYILGRDYVEALLGVNKEKENVSTSYLLDRHYKKVELFINNNLVYSYNETFFKRVMNRIFFVFKKVFLKLKTLFNLIKKAFKKIVKLNKITLSKQSFKNFVSNANNKAIEDIYYDINTTSGYNSWLEENKSVEEIHNFKYNPLISIVIPVYNVESIYLEKCLDSVLNQSYTNFEICIADDCSTNKNTIKTLKKYEKKDKRIKIVYREKNGHISEATNSAINISSGEFIGLLDNDDELTPDALYEVVKVLNENKKLDFIYSDEDKIDLNGNYCYPHFKPDWSPDTMYSCNYICHFSVFRKKMLDVVGLYNSDFNGAQDYDLFLRILEKTDNIYHIPKVLYHWRMLETSTALAGSKKDYAYEAGKKAIEASLNRRNIKASVNTLEDIKMYEVRYNVVDNPLISIIIPTKDASKVLKRCIDSIYNKTTYNNFEIILIDNNSCEQSTFDLIKNYEKEHNNFKSIRLECEFNYSYINNQGVKECNGDYIVLLNNDTEIITENWLEIMVGYASQKHIGCVGAKLLYPDKTVQHTGVVLGCGGVASHAFLRLPYNALGYFSRVRITYDWSCVTAACLMIKKDKFYEVNGLDENLKVAYNDVDFNMKVLDKGYYNVVTPSVCLYHYESYSRGLDEAPAKKERFKKEINYIVDKWKNKIIEDKFYNKNLSKYMPFYLDRKKK